jgi:D-glycero-D-manno-heptose 1,7-bisphosphate phosphatase
MCDRFEAEGTAISRVYHCPHHPVEGLGEYRRDHPWRKPNPGMLLQAVSDLGLDPVHCAIVGDKMSDMEAGAAAGIGLCILIGTRELKKREPACEVAADLRQALALLRSRFVPAAPAERSGGA